MPCEDLEVHALSQPELTSEQRRHIDEFFADLRADPANWRDADLPCEFCGQWHGETYKRFDPFLMMRWRKKKGLENTRGFRIPFN